MTRPAGLRSPFPTALLLAGLLAPIAGADTLHIDAGAVSCPGSGTVAEPYCTIQAALDASQSGDTIQVRPGTYAETIDYLGKDVAVRSTAGAAVTILDPGVPAPGSTVTFDGGEGPGALLEGFTVSGGSGTAVTLLFPALAGGGIFCRDSSPTLRDNVVTDNVAEYGTGVFVDGGAPLLQGNTITDESGTEGAGLYARQAHGLTLCGNLLSLNHATSQGGAASIVDSLGVSLSGNTFDDNLASSSGGVWLGETHAVLCDNVFVRNRNDEGEGGAVGTAGGTVTVAGNLFEQNAALFEGGGLVVWSGDVTVIDNEFRDNHAGQVGGAVAVFSGDAVIRDNLFVANRAGLAGSALELRSSGTVSARLNRMDGQLGGAAIRVAGGAPEIVDTLVVHGENVAVEVQGGTPTVKRCTFTDNTFGGLATFGGTLTVVSTISHGNKASPGNEIFVLGGTVDVTYSDIEGGYPGVGNTNAPPFFTDAANGDYRLLIRSSLVDAGDPADTVCGLDLDGYSRRVDGSLGGVAEVDMGAFESAHVELAAAVTAGPTLEIDTFGTSSLPTFLLAGLPAAAPLCAERWGAFVVDLGAPFTLLDLGPGLIDVDFALPGGFGGVEVTLQAVVLDSGGGSWGNTSAGVNIILP